MKLSRRRFLTFTGTTAAGSAALGGSLIFNPAHAQEGSQQPGKVNLDYPVTTLNNAADLKVGQPVRFNYPDDASPCMLVKTGRETRGGVGPDGDIVAYSILCTHMGCPVSYSAEQRTFKCPCHFQCVRRRTQWPDGLRSGNGKSPRILLNYRDSDDAIDAVGVEGLIYGRQANILPNT